MDFANWYKFKIESNQEEPPEMIWDSIQDNLDIDNVWIRITTDLDKKRKNYTLFWAIAASIALFISAGILTMRNSPFEKYTTPLVWQFSWPGEIQLPSGHFTEKSLVASMPEHSDYKTPANRNATIVSKKQENRVNIKEEPTLLAAAPVKITEMPHRFQVERVKDDSIKNIIADITDQTQFKDLLSINSSEETNSGFSIGVVGQFANTWLLNQKTLRGLNRQELTATNASFGNNLGLIARNHINKNTTLLAELHFISQSRQNYNEYIEGRYSSTALELEYISFSLMVGRRLGNYSSPHWVLTGIYTGALQQATEFINESSFQVNNDYRSLDFGIMAGYEYQFPLSGNLFLGTGAFAKIGLRNAFSGNQNIPDYLNHTRNAAFMVSISLNYSLK